MFGKQRLKHQQCTEFVRKGYLIVPGKLSADMADELLQALEWADRSIRGKRLPPECDGVN